MTIQSTTHKTSRTSQFAAVALLWLMFAQMTFEARLTSLTVDEPLHIISGYSHLKTGDARLVEEHPPLAKIIAAAPLLLDPHLGDPRQANGWEAGSLVLVTRAMLTRYPALERVTFAARVPIMWLGVLLGALVYRWAADWRRAGRTAGLIALGLCALDPNIVAHAQLATTDVGVALFILATLYSLWRWMRHPTWTRLAMAGLMLGLALASKMSALLTLPIVALIVFTAFARRQPNHWHGALKQVGQAVVTLIAIVGLGTLVVWAVYGFELRWAPGLPVPIPAYSHLIPLKSLFDHQRAGHSTFLMGRNSQMGWWDYFPIAFALKTPLPTLILLVSAAFGAAFPVVQRLSQKQFDQLGQWMGQAGVLLGFPVVYFASATMSTVDLGYRHLLPILPFVFVFAASMIKGPFQKIEARIKRVILIVLGAWYVFNAATAFPRPLEFFNELAGGPANGYHYLVDSNLDWGQSFKEVASYLKQHGIEHIKLSAFTFLDPAMYGLNYESLPPSWKSPAQFDSPFNPAPGVYVIGATSLQGVATPDINTYAFFRAMSPTARIGHGLFVYEVKPRQAALTWAAVCANPAPLLSTEETQTRFGRSDLRVITINCQQSWVYPADKGAGEYIIPPNVQAPPDAILEAQTRDANGKPLYNVYRVGAEPPLGGLAPTAKSVEGPLDLVNYRVDQMSVYPGVPVELWTFWRVKEIPSHPLSLMAHLVKPDGAPIVVGDGLGAPIDQWRLGDVIVQRHRLLVPKETLPGRYSIQIGAYWLDTQQRWSARDENGKTDDKLTIGSVEVLR